VQQRVEGAGAELVAVAGEFLDEPQAEDGPLRRMMQDLRRDLGLAYSGFLFLSAFVIEIRYTATVILSSAKEKHFAT
jgi:hypothetical protein